MAELVLRPSGRQSELSDIGEDRGSSIIAPNTAAFSGGIPALEKGDGRAIPELTTASQQIKLTLAFLKMLNVDWLWNVLRHV